MLKKIFASFIGSMAALWISGAAAFFLLFMFIGILAAGDTTDSGYGKHSILYLDLTGEITDQYRPLTFQDAMMGYTEEAQSFEEILQSLRHAAKDENIDGIYINCGGSSLGYALREELVEAIKAFKKEAKDKFIIAYGDSYAQGDYYVATTADKIYVNPIGSVDVRGLAVQMPFFKDALDKLGVEMQIVKVGTFKSAVEPFILSQPSEPSLLQTHVFIDAIWDNMTETIARNRDVSQSDVNTWADSIIATARAEELISLNVVTAAKYRREVEDELKKLTKIKDNETLRLVTPKEYLLTRSETPAGAFAKLLNKEEKHIAVLYAVGDIVDQGSTGIVGETMVPQIIDLADDDNVAGLVLRVNSGGGSAFASEQIWEALEYFKSKNKPFYVSMGDYAASGGYYISCGADRIYADANTITGSIGIFGMIPCAKKLANEHLGINFVTVQTNPNGDMGSIFEPLTPQQHNALQRAVDEGYALFTGRVASGRDLPVDSVFAIAEGRVWDGRTALKIGLVDELGSLGSAVKAMSKKLNMEDSRFVSYPKIELSPLDAFFAGAGGMEAAQNMSLDAFSFKALTPAETRRCVDLLRNINTVEPVQARMPMYFVH